MSAPPPTPLDGESRVANVIAMVTGTLAIATLTTVARFYTRAVVIKKLGWDDWMAVAGLLFTIGCGVAVGMNIRNGLGKHIWTINMAGFPEYLKTFYVTIVMYGAGIAAIKATFLLQYQRVFAVGTHKNRFLWALIIVSAWSVASLLVATFSCTPIDAFWDSTIQGRCIPNHPWWEINAAGNIITDFAVFCLPIPTLWKLQLPKGQKIALLGIFGLGFFTCALSLVRIKYLQIAADMTWENVDSATWSMIELVSGIVCANLATLRPLLKTIFPSLGGSSVGQQGHSGGTGGSGSGHIPLGSSQSARGWSRGRTHGASVTTTTGPVYDVERQQAEWKLHEKPSHESSLR